MKILILVLILGAGIMSKEAIAKSVWKGSAILIVKEDKVEVFKQAVAKIINPTRKEKGCISYEGYQVLNEDKKLSNRFEFHEIWASKEAMMIDHKENSSHMKSFFKKIKADSAATYLESFQVDGKYVDVL